MSARHGTRRGGTVLDLLPGEDGQTAIEARVRDLCTSRLLAIQGRPGFDDGVDRVLKKPDAAWGKGPGSALGLLEAIVRDFVAEPALDDRRVAPGQECFDRTLYTPAERAALEPYTEAESLLGPPDFMEAVG
ncbi:MAG: hypothetical protein ABIL09_11005 [Gemmatimonadota bacterium]